LTFDLPFDLALFAKNEIKSSLYPSHGMQPPDPLGTSGAGGAFQPWSFGFQGRVTGGARGLANLYDVSGDVTVNAHLAVTLYWGYAQGKSVIQTIYPRGKDGHLGLGYVEATYKF
jgi:hypothetical protein